MMMKSGNMMRRHLELQGPRPTPLMINKNSKKVTKEKTKPNSSSNIHQGLFRRPADPVIVYLISPKIIHVQPEEFMDLVQQLTGNEGVRGSKINKQQQVASHHHHQYPCSSSSTSCLISQGDHFSESQQKKLNNNRAEYYDDDYVPFGIPTTTTTATSNVAKIYSSYGL